MKSQTCCFTGHREMTLPVGEVKHRMKEVISYLVSKGVFYFGVGGSWGADMLMEEVLISMKLEDPRIKMILVLPCKDHDIKWLPEQRANFSYIRTRADKVVYTSEKYESGCMHKRNRHLVNFSKYCICYWERNSGGTYYTVDYAMKNGLEIYNLAQTNYMTPLDYDNHP